jgi:hypothetical protein
MLCDYGCGQEATHQFKNGKWCCCSSFRGFKKIREEHTKKLKGKKKSADVKEKQRKAALNKWKNKEYREKIFKTIRSDDYIEKKRFISKHMWKTDETRDKILKTKRSKKYREKMSILAKQTIKNIKKKYQLFSQIEEMRYNPDKPGEIQIHCKNHNCKNSKELGGWFTPTYIQLYERIRQTESEIGNGGSYFYCSDECKQECPLYNLHSDPLKNNELPYTYEEKQIWISEVLKRDNYECQKCGSTENLHCHHIHPVKLFPEFALDPDNGIVLCEKCHYEIGHKTGTECSTGNLANVICR